LEFKKLGFVPDFEFRISDFGAPSSSEARRRAY